MASTSAEADFNAETAIKDAQQQFDLGMEALKVRHNHPKPVASTHLHTASEMIWTPLQTHLARHLSCAHASMAVWGTTERLDYTRQPLSHRAWHGVC